MSYECIFIIQYFEYCTLPPIRYSIDDTSWAYLRLAYRLNLKRILALTHSNSKKPYTLIHVIITYFTHTSRSMHSPKETLVLFWYYDLQALNGVIFLNNFDSVLGGRGTYVGPIHYLWCVFQALVMVYGHSACT